MIVRELRKALEGVPDDMPVIIVWAGHGWDDVKTVKIGCYDKLDDDESTRPVFIIE